MLTAFFRRHQQRLNRPLEMLPGLFSWSLLLAPFWASFIWPHYVAYFVLFFDIYWLYKSVTFAYYFANGFLRMRAHQDIDWMRAVRDVAGWQRVHHVVIIPTFKEPLGVLTDTIQALAAQTYPRKHLTLVLATEQRDPHAAQKAATLTKRFADRFAHFFVTVHPDIPGEVKGKSSNMAWAGKWVKQELVDTRGYDLSMTTVTSCDADSLLHPMYFANLTYLFLSDENRRYRFFQSPIIYYANYWNVPLPVRIVATFGSTWSVARLMRPDKLINYSTYSMSFQLCHEIGYWSTDVIPEDYHIFLKSFFQFGSRVEVRSIFLPTYADAAESRTYVGTLVNQYKQLQRWAWGVTDDPYAIKQFFLKAHLPLLPRFVRTLRLFEDHFLWPVNWFFLTLGATIPPLINPLFAQTVIGYNLPRFAWWIITATSFFFVIVLILDSFMRPPRPKEVKFYRLPLVYLQWITIPVIGFFFSALPGIDAHTRLMLGKYLEYRVTEKV